MKAQMNDKKSLEIKINELVNNSRNMIDQKIKIINNLLISIKEENEHIINIYIFL